MLVPATMDRRYVPDMLASFKKLRPDYLVLTKSDESRDLALVTALASEVPWPIAFLTDGQRVPQDLKAARACDIVARILVDPRAKRGEVEAGLPKEASTEPGPASEEQSPRCALRSSLAAGSTFERAA
jgi:flagellar biosynthesis GTPase FlhF